MYLAVAGVAMMMSGAASVSAAGSRVALTYFAGTKHNIVERFGVAVWAMLIGNSLGSAFDGPEMHSLAFSEDWTQHGHPGLEERVWSRGRFELFPVRHPWDERIWACCIRAGNEARKVAHLSASREGRTSVQKAP